MNYLNSYPLKHSLGDESCFKHQRGMPLDKGYLMTK